VPKPTASDDDLMQAAHGGEEAAFSELVRRHRSWVRWLMLAFVRDEDQAEDLTQEAFCRVYQHAGEYRPQGNFPAWMKRIAINLARDYLRRQRRATLISLSGIEDSVEDIQPFDPAEALASDVLRQELRDAIQSLPDEQRLALVMHYFGDMSLQDIAWVLKCPVGTVKSRLFYALRRVRATLTARWENEEGDPLP
jgi:RNA polymerase sigma-70 factor, ECF subfamily